MDGTRPGINNAFQIEKFPVDEQRIIRKLSQSWYLTNEGSEIKLGSTSIYRYFLMKPSDDLKEVINFDREIIAVFSPYERFEPRTLDAFDAAAINYQSLRLERICQVLVSKDHNIVKKVSDIVKNDPESPVVIPFYYGEISNATSNDVIYDRIREAFYSRDIFAFQSPLKKDTYFFGRSQLIHSLLDRYRSGENSGLFGLRKSGKTSIVYGIERALDSRKEPCIVFDCQNPVIHQRRWNELLSHIIKETKLRFSLSLKTHEDKYAEKDAASAFEADAKQVHRALNKRPLLIIFDEIERISPKTGSSLHWRDGDDFTYFWQSLRSVFQANRGLYSYLLVGTNPACIEESKIGANENPIFASVPLDYVPGFRTEQVREMVLKIGGFMGILFDENLYQRLADDFGGHPFLIRQFCSKLHRITMNKRRPFKVDRSVYTTAITQFESESAAYVEMILNVLRDSYPDEYEMARYLALNDIDSFSTLSSDSPLLTNHLIGYGLIERGEAGYFYRVEAVRAYLEKAHRFQRLSLSPEERLAEVSERRNNLEKRLRVIIKQQIKARDGKSKATATILSAIEQRRRDTLANFDIDSLFDPRSSPLYFKDLRMVIDREWETFKNIFSLEKSRLLLILDDINTLRADAHAKDIPDDEFQQARLHFSKIEKVLDDWE